MYIMNLRADLKGFVRELKSNIKNKLGLTYVNSDVTTYV